MDTSKLSRADKLELIQLLEEREKRARLSKPTFVPNEKQLPLILSEALERYIFCGNGWGKSTVLVNEVHWAATGFNPITGKTTPVPAKMVLLLDSPEKVEDFLGEYRRWNPLAVEQCHKRGKPHISFIDYPTGSTLTIMSHAVEPLKLEGSQWTHIFADEPPPKPVFTALFRGGRIKGRPCRVLLAGTPISAAWLRTEVYEPWVKGQTPHVECFRGDTADNRENLEDGYIERFTAKLSEHEKQVRLHGQFYDLEGLALSHLFRRATHVVSSKGFVWERENPSVIIIDPHPSKPHNAIVLGADRDGHLYVLDEYKEKAVARKFMKSLIGLDWFTKYRVLDIVYDSLGNSETTSGEGFKPFGTVINEVLAQHGLGRARATSYDEKSDEDFIDRIQDALVMPTEANNFGLLIPKLRLLDTCGGSISDIENVQWKRDRSLDQNKPALEISNRDWLACIKYGLACNIYFDKKKGRAYYTKKKAYGVDLPAATKARAHRLAQPKRKQTADDWNEDW